MICEPCMPADVVELQVADFFAMTTAEQSGYDIGVTIGNARGIRCVLAQR